MHHKRMKLSEERQENRKANSAPIAAICGGRPDRRLHRERRERMLTPEWKDAEKRSGGTVEYCYEELAGMLDHSMLQPTFTAAQFEQGLDLALAYGVASVCILPWYLKRCAERLAGSAVRPTTVIGFPLGGQTPAVKVAEAQQAIRDGAVELDLVANISAARSGRWPLVAAEVRAVTDLAHEGGQKVKVIFETCYLDEAEKIRLCAICSGAGADWVKTSTGFGSGGATDDDLRLLRRHCPARVQIKASGGIRSLARVLEVRALGASRVGTSATRTILDEARAALLLDPLAPRN